jgi:hypothetical protein
MNTERQQNYTDGKTEVLGEKNLSQCHFVQYMSHMVWPGIEPGLSR